MTKEEIEQFIPDGQFCHRCVWWKCIEWPPYWGDEIIIPGKGPAQEIEFSGRCHRFPPSTVAVEGRLHAVFPQTECDDFCGEFKQA